MNHNITRYLQIWLPWIHTNWGFHQLLLGHRIYKPTSWDFGGCIILKKILYSKAQLAHRCNVLALHKKWSFSLWISSVNVTKSAGNYGFDHIYWRNSWWKTSFFVQCRLLNEACRILMIGLVQFVSITLWA